MGRYFKKDGSPFPRAPKILCQGPPVTLEEDEDEDKGTQI